MSCEVSSRHSKLGADGSELKEYHAAGIIDVHRNGLGIRPPPWSRGPRRRIHGKGWPSGLLPLRGNHRGHARDREADPLLENRLHLRKKCGVVAIVVHGAIANGLAIGRQDGIDALKTLEQRVEDEISHARDRLQRWWLNIQLLPVAHIQVFLEARVNAVLAAELPVVVQRGVKR